MPYNVEIKDDNSDEVFTIEQLEELKIILEEYEKTDEVKIERVLEIK